MSIKLLDPKATFKVIPSSDSALENETPEELQVAEGEAPKATRYDQYVENGDLKESVLKFKEGQVPDRFILRPLLADELADINSKYLFIDTAARKAIVTNRAKMFLECFSKAYLGLESGGKTVKPSLDEIPFDIQVEMGSVVSLLTSLGKNEKK